MLLDHTPGIVDAAVAGNPGYGETAAWFAVTTVTATGYDAEFRISLAILGNPKPGDIIGFNVAVNDDDDGGDANHPEPTKVPHRSVFLLRSTPAFFPRRWL